MRTARTSEIPARVARHVLWHFGHGGQEPGSFTRALIVAIASADPGNQWRLAQGFPACVRAVQLAQNTEDGITRLATIARGDA